MFNFIKILAILSGNILQFYDFTIYAFLTPHISRNFFNFKNDFYSFIFTFLIFSCGYISRPLGALIFGFLGDTKGRSVALSKTIFFSTIATFLIGIIPSYEQIGVLAPSFLVILRLLQGLSVSGEEGSSVVLLFEKINLKKGEMGAYVLSSVLFGVVLGIFICELINELMLRHILNDWWWRGPFLFSLPLGMVLFKCRYYLNDFDLFGYAKKNNFLKKNPIKYLFQKNFQVVLFAILTVSIYSVSTSTLIVHLPYYFIEVLRLSYGFSMSLIGASILLIIFFTPIMSKTLSKKNPIDIYRFSLIGFVIFSPILFFLISLGNIIGLFIGVVMFSILIALLSSVIFLIIIDVFPYGVRCTGVSFSFNASVMIFSSTTPIVLVLLEKYFSSKIVPGYYLSLLSMVVFILYKYNLCRFYQIKNAHKLYQFGDE